MSNWVAFEPACGWRAFERHQELLRAIWEGLSESEGQWHYMNLCAESSIWESCKDGSSIEMWHESTGEQKLVELKVSSGMASAYMEPIVKTFQLVSSPCQCIT